MKQVLNSLTLKESNRFLKRKPLNLHSGESVEVRSEREIRGTLDENGEFEGLQFSLEMTKYCGGTFRVFRRADKLIIEGIGMRRLKNTVILADVSCDGHAHEDCKKTCLLLWKDVWLRRVTESSSKSINESARSKFPMAYNERIGRESRDCQVSGLKNSTSALPFWDIRQYMWDIESGTFSPTERLNILLTFFLSHFQRMLGSDIIRRDHGHLRRTPSLALCLEQGELVQVRSKKEILRTLDLKNRNRGLAFTPEMSRYCGGIYRVLKRIDVIKDEKSGEMRKIANTVLLEGVTCDGKEHGGCPRNCFCLWREIWLSRVSERQPTQ